MCVEVIVCYIIVVFFETRCSDASRSCSGTVDSQRRSGCCWCT